MTSNPPDSVLVYVGFDRIGDGLLKLPFVRGLRAAFPSARITWLAGREDSVYAGVLADLAHGLIDEIIENAGIGLSFGELFHGLSKSPLGGRRFDLIIDTQRIFWTSLSLKRVPLDAFIPPRRPLPAFVEKASKGLPVPENHAAAAFGPVGAHQRPGLSDPPNPGFGPQQRPSRRSRPAVAGRAGIHRAGARIRRAAEMLAAGKLHRTGPPPGIPRAGAGVFPGPEGNRVD